MISFLAETRLPVGFNGVHVGAILANIRKAAVTFTCGRWSGRRRPPEAAAAVRSGCHGSRRPLSACKCFRRHVNDSGDLTYFAKYQCLIVAIANGCMHGETGCMLQSATAVHVCSWRRRLWLSVSCEKQNSVFVMCEMDCEMKIRNYGIMRNFSEIPTSKNLIREWPNESGPTRPARLLQIFFGKLSDGLLQPVRK